MLKSISRRFFIIASGLAALPLKAQGKPFAKESLLAQMREMARTPFQPISQTRVLGTITNDAYANIRYKEPSEIEPLHQGGFFQTPTQIHIVENGIAREMLYEASKFENLPPVEGNVGFSGFKYHLDGEEILRFQAGTTFRIKALTQTFGTLARALVINVAESTGEEFPGFRQFYIEKESANPQSLKVYGLFSSENISGLACFTINFSNTTLVDVEINFIPRNDLAHIGFAPMTATYLFGLNDRSLSDDVRGAVHDVTGLSMISGSGEQIYRPLHNPETLQISAFLDHNPKGFGLVQLDRRFELFQDLDNQFERRPTLWIEPRGDWGEGQIQLIEIPSEAQSNRNIIAYWRPKKVFTAKQEINISYSLTAGWDRPVSLLATVNTLRIGRAPQKRRRLIVEFTGENVNSLEKVKALTPMLSNIRGKLSNISMRFNPETSGARVSFELDPEGNSSCEIRLVLENDKKPFSETMLYRWTP